MNLNRLPLEGIRGPNPSLANLVKSEKKKNACISFFQILFLSKFVYQRTIQLTMKLFQLILTFLLLSFTANAQTLSPFVIGSAGDLFSNTQANASLAFTVGEMAMVETFQNQNHFLTQGFHQPELNLVGVEDEDYFYEFVVFPNPANAVLNIRYRLKIPGIVEMRLVNLNGVQVLETYQDQFIVGIHEGILNLEHIAQGLYFLQVSYRVPSRRIEQQHNYKINVIKH